MINDTVPIGAWIEPKSRLLDLGCGDGTLLRRLIDDYQVQGYGLEIDPDSINQCIQKGLNVIEQDLNKGLKNFPDNSFDTVLMSQTLQALRNPHLVLDEMLRIGNRCIVTFPNFGHWQTRVFWRFEGACRSQSNLPINGMTHPTYIYLPIKISKHSVLSARSKY